jgi:hypothetical protein
MLMKRQILKLSTGNLLGNSRIKLEKPTLKLTWNLVLAVTRTQQNSVRMLKTTPSLAQDVMVLEMRFLALAVTPTSKLTCSRSTLPLLGSSLSSATES